MKFFDYDPHTGIKQTFKRDGDKVIIASHKDIQGSLDAIQQERSNDTGNWKGTFHKVASIDPIVLEMWRKELQAEGRSNCNPLAPENKTWFIAKLNNRDYGKLRTKDGNI